MTDILKPNFHKTTNTEGDSFVGIRMNNNSLGVYYPECFAMDSENFSKDIFLLLKCIKLSKIATKNDELVNSKENQGKMAPILSYMWIIADYKKNGILKIREKVKTNSIKGKIDWKKTLQQDPIVYDGNIIFIDFISDINTNINNELVEIYKYCLKISIDKLGWLYKMNSNFICNNKVSKAKLCFYINILKKHLRKTFDDVKKERLSNMLQILENVNLNFGKNNFEYGTYSFHAAYEKMINLLFGGIIDKNDYNPNGEYEIYDAGVFDSPKLRPDTIIEDENEIYVIDAKYYRYFKTNNRKDLPETQSIQKQITYGKHASENVAKDKKVFNAFLMPSDMMKDNNVYLRRIGTAKAKWEKDIDENQTYSKVIIMLIDLRYLIENYDKGTNNLAIEKLKEEIKGAFI